jgi:hypothetical protein
MQWTLRSSRLKNRRSYVYEWRNESRGGYDFDVVSLKSRCRKGGAWPPTTQRSHATYSVQPAKRLKVSQRVTVVDVGSFRNPTAAKLFLKYELYLLRGKFNQKSVALLCCEKRKDTEFGEARRNLDQIRNNLGVKYIT